MGHRKLFEAVQNGAFGALRHMRTQWLTPSANAYSWRARADVGRWWVLAAVGTHCLDQIRWLMRPQCGEITKAESVINRSAYQGSHDETALTAYQFEKGATAELCASVLFKGPRIVEVYGSDGYAICTETLGPHGEGRIETHEGEFTYNPTNLYVGEIADFAAATRDGRKPEIDDEEGATNVDLLLRAVGD